MSKLIAVFRRKAFQDLPGYTSGVSGVATFVFHTPDPINSYADALVELRAHDDELVAFLYDRHIRIPNHEAFPSEGMDKWEWIVNYTLPHLYVGSRKGPLLTDVSDGAMVGGRLLEWVGSSFEVPYHAPRALVPVRFKGGGCGIVAWDLTQRSPCKVTHMAPEIDALIEASEYMPVLESESDCRHLVVTCTVQSIMVRITLSREATLRLF